MFRQALFGKPAGRLYGDIESAAPAKSPAPLVLFIDEIHTLIGAGGQAGTGDAANLLKPALARGTLRTIGATTWARYKRYIEKDPASTRRFQVLQVAEPSEAVAVDRVRGLVQTFSAHHGGVARDEAIRGAVTLFHRYIPSRQLPDKAISVLDTACARVALSHHATPRELDDVRQRLAAARHGGRTVDASAHGYASAARHTCALSAYAAASVSDAGCRRYQRGLHPLRIDARWAALGGSRASRWHRVACGGRVPVVEA